MTCHCYACTATEPMPCDRQATAIDPWRPTRAEAAYEDWLDRRNGPAPMRPDDPWAIALARAIENHRLHTNDKHRRTA